MIMSFKRIHCLQINFHPFAASNLLYLDYSASPWWPDGNSPRVMAGTWLLTAFILGTIYRTNLKAMLIVPKLHLPFSNFAELMQTDIPTYIPNGSYMYDNVEVSEKNKFLFLKKYSVYDDDDDNGK